MNAGPRGKKETVTQKAAKTELVANAGTVILIDSFHPDWTNLVILERTQLELAKAAALQRYSNVVTACSSMRLLH